MMKCFSMPADFREETIDAYARLNEVYEDSRVINTYGSISVGDYFGTGRNISSLPKADFSRLVDYVRHSLEHRMGFSYALNASYMQNREFTEEGVVRIKRFLRNLHEAGVRELIIAMPPMIEIARSTGLDFKIKASVIAQIVNANKAILFKEFGVDQIVVDESTNRNFGVLKRIRSAFGENVQIIANVICHQDCHYRMFHYNQNSGDATDVSNEVSRGYYLSRCVLRMYADVTNLFKCSWIRPEDLHHYTDIGIHHFKIQGRHNVMQGDPVRAVECYMKGRYDGDLKDLLFLFAPSDIVKLSLDNRKLDGFLKPFVEDEDFCRRDCTACDYCESFARKCFDVDAAKKVAAAATQFIKQNDKFTQLICSTHARE